MAWRRAPRAELAALVATLGAALAGALTPAVAPPPGLPGVAAVAAAGVSPASAAPSRLGQWFDSASSAGFAAASEPRAFVFPRDHGPHPDFQHEWWYLSGQLDGERGERFGFELTFFRFALAPAVRARPLATAVGRTPAEGALSAWRANTIYMAHFAVTDMARQRFRFEQKLERAALGLAGAQTQPLRVWADDWFLAADEPSAAPRAGRWRLHAMQSGYELELTLEPESAPVPEGDAGLSRKSDEPSAASYYYSLPRLAAQGRLLRDREPLALRGEAWLDREWGSGGLGPQQAGWDWFALQLDDGNSLMFYALRDRDGRRDVHSAGSWITAGGERRALSDAEVAIAVTDTWRSRSGERYPAGWRLRVPALALELSVRPLLADQELQTTPRYWEGAVEVSGARAERRVGGRGYVELVGYAREREH
jgi:predicted secreted hydrolase